MTLNLEAVMHVVIVVPHVFAARVEARIPHYRGRVQSSEHRDGSQTIRARVADVSVPAFVSALMADTNGTARTSMVLYEHCPVPQPPGDPAAGVREPRPKVPTGRSGAIAVPEPQD